ncbi:thylakoid ADP,ATP carrier protein, chloroplastic-like [Wolffia australiana]
MQMKGSPYDSILAAFTGIVECGGVFGVNSGFVPKALKSLPNSRIKLTIFDTVKGLIAMNQKELQSIIEENRAKMLS